MTQTLSGVTSVSALLLFHLTSQAMLEVKIFFYYKFPTDFAPNKRCTALEHTRKL